jgi:lysophospholipase L1-like esterase
MGLVQMSVKLFLAGDSTVASYPKNEAPMAGWGQFLQDSFSKEVVIHNHAKCGASSNSFIEEGRLATILEKIQTNDYLFIQFGHNDQKEYGTEVFFTYPFYLGQYVTASREKGAFPVLVTSVHRRNFDDSGRLVNTLGEYPNSMIRLAKTLDVPLINLWEETAKLYQSLGEEGSKQLFTWLKPSENSNYPDGIEDNTHFCENGAKKIAELVLKEIKELQLPITKFIR